MKTYQDYLQVAGGSLQQVTDFLQSVVREHQRAPQYKTALDAEDYYRHKNPTILRLQKFIYNRFGTAVPDRWAANNKIANRYYFYFITQLVSYILGNGVIFNEQSNKPKLGKSFDQRLQDMAVNAQNAGMSFGFWNLDHLDVFKFTEFAPLWDEETGELKAGVRFWQIDPQKPLRLTFFDVDGYTEYIKRQGSDMEVLKEKSAYRTIIIGDQRDREEGTEIREGQNYGTLPIVPLYNINRQSELVGCQGTLDAYDLIASQLVNAIDDGNFIYWILKNCDGMSLEDDEEFIEQLKMTRVAHANGGDDASIEAHSVVADVDPNETALNRLRQQLYDDFMALDVKQIQAGNVTATQINAAYDPLDKKADLFERNLYDFMDEILRLAGIEDEVSFKRSKIANEEEYTQMVLSAGAYLDEETVLKKLPWVSVDEVDGIVQKKDAEEADRFIDAGPEGVGVDG